MKAKEFSLLLSLGDGQSESSWGLPPFKAIDFLLNRILAKGDPWNLAGSPLGVSDFLRRTFHKKPFLNIVLKTWLFFGAIIKAWVLEKACPPSLLEKLRYLIPNQGGKGFFQSDCRSKKKRLPKEAGIVQKGLNRLFPGPDF